MQMEIAIISSQAGIKDKNVRETAFLTFLDRVELQIKESQNPFLPQICADGHQIKDMTTEATEEHRGILSKEK
jgi:hypothetical protein